MKGRPVDVVDPGLTLADGTKVPFMPSREFYEHLGIWQRVDGDTGVVFPRLLGKAGQGATRNGSPTATCTSVRASNGTSTNYVS